MTPTQSRERLEELLATGATQQLTPAEEAEVDVLLAAFPEEDPEGFERAATALHLALVGPPEPLPAALAEKLRRSAATVAPAPGASSPPRRTAWVAWSGWAVAAGLAWLLLYTNWPKPRVAGPEPALAERREALLKDRSAKATRFDATEPGAAASVVWSTEKQEGYLEVHGLPPNDPAKERYQLWIVDPAQEFPIDGGVFDVQSEGPTLVPVRHPIRVSDAQKFAVTKEKPSGVVRSKGPMLVVLAPKPG